MRLTIWSAAVLATLLSGSTTAQFVGFPSCISNCIKSENIKCSIGDIACICKASRGQKVTDIVVCAKSSCDQSLDVHAIFGLFDVACDLAGVPVPSSVIAAAESAAATVSPSTTKAGHGGHGGGQGTAETVTSLTTTDKAGETVVLIIPIDIETIPGTTITSSLNNVLTIFPSGAASSSGSGSSGAAASTVTATAAASTTLSTTSTETATTTGNSSVQTGAGASTFLHSIPDGSRFSGMASMLALVCASVVAILIM